MAEQVTLRAERRTVLGKKVKRLRQQGILPANIYGRGLESVPIQLDAREFLRTVRRTGVRHMFQLQLEGEDAPRYVLIRGLAREGGTGDPIHVDFYQVDLQRPIETSVALHPVGEAPAVRDLAGTLIMALDTVTVRCRPLDLPDFIEVDLFSLNSFDAVITVGDLKPPPGVEIVTDPSIAVATVSPPRLRLEGEPGEEGEEAEEAAPAPEEDEEE